MEELLQEVLKKIDSLNTTLQEILKVTKSDNSSLISAILGIENKLIELKNSTSENTDRNDEDIVIINDENNFTPDIQSLQQQATKIRRSIISVWKKSINERKQAYYNHLKCRETADVYVEWSQKDKPVLPRKLRLRTIPGEHIDDKEIRIETAISAFNAEIKLMKNRAERYKVTYEKVDSEMISIFDKRANEEVSERLRMMWEKECTDEEERSATIWKQKGAWLESYESQFGSELFISETNHESIQVGRRGNLKDSNTFRPNNNTTGENRQRKINHGHGQNYNGNGANVRHNPVQQFRNNGHYRSDNRRQQFRNNGQYRSDNHGQHTHNNKYNRHQMDSRPIQRNGTTYIGQNIRASFLGQSPYDKDGGSRTEETVPKTMD